MFSLNLQALLPLLQAGSSGGTPGFLLPVLLILVFYMFFIRPQQRRQKEQKLRAANLQKGQKIVTIGGIHGVVTDLHETTVTIKTAKDSHIEFSRSAISNVVQPQAANEAKPQGGSFFERFRKKKEAVKEEVVKEEKTTDKKPPLVEEKE